MVVTSFKSTSPELGITYILRCHPDILCVDIDAVAALEPRRAERNKTLDVMQSISTNEKRLAMGYEPVDGGDVLLVNSGLIPLEMAGADVPTMPIL